MMKNSLNRFKKKLYKPISKLTNTNKLISGNYPVTFPHEGGFEVCLPGANILDAIFGRSKKLKKLSDFANRPHKEPLLRKIVFELYEQGYLNKKQSVIDIGCWLADNSIVWASFLEIGAVVHAIDPSKDNIDFCKELAKKNNISNINWVQAVCSNLPGQALTHNGSIDHATFEKEERDTSGSIISCTLDEIIEDSNYKDIALIHVDVEGFEEKVLKGAEQIIEKCQPVIIFEQHISTEDIWPIVNFLKSKNYSIYMINEVLSGCNLDCRNFIAFNNEFKKPIIFDLNHASSSKSNIWHASMQGALIPFD